MFNPADCHVERTREHNYLVKWRLPVAGQRVAVYMSDSPDHYYSGRNPGAPILYTSENEALIPNPEKDVRHYFYLQSEQGDALILAERQLILQGSPNFRDLGGYQTDDGRRLKWGRLYRSGKLSALSEADMHYVRRLGLTLICDFRQVVEQELEPTRIHSESSPILTSLPVKPGGSAGFIENLHNGIIAVQDAAGFMEDINRELVVNQMPQYAEMFQLLLAGNEQLLIHCASGKDRTGVGAALILDVLGVNEKTIVNDYLLTNKYLPIEKEVDRLSKEFTDHTGSTVSEAILRPMMEVRPEYIRACFEEIRKRYESREHFYETALGLDTAGIADLKDRYLH